MPRPRWLRWGRAHAWAATSRAAATPRRSQKTAARAIQCAPATRPCGRRRVHWQRRMRIGGPGPDRLGRVHRRAGLQEQPRADQGIHVHRRSDLPRDPGHVRGRAAACLPHRFPADASPGFSLAAPAPSGPASSRQRHLRDGGEVHGTSPPGAPSRQFHETGVTLRIRPPILLVEWLQRGLLNSRPGDARAAEAGP